MTIGKRRKNVMGTCDVFELLNTSIDLEMLWDGNMYNKWEWKSKTGTCLGSSAPI